MRLLHVTDTHLGARQVVRGAPRGWSRADDHHAALEAALGAALRDEVDVVVHSGDLFDRSRPPARAVQRAGALLLEVARRVPVVIVPGNHDRRGLRRWLPQVHPGLHVHDTPTAVDVAGVRLALVPFVRDADGWAHAARRAWGGGADLLVCHQAVDGARVPGLTFRAGVQRDTLGARHLPPGCRHVLCGHIHPRQVTRVGEAEVVQPGSSERTAFSEHDQVKGWAVWTLERSVSWQWVDGATRPMVEVDSEAAVAAVTPGALVRARPELEDAVLARGGWLWGLPARPRRPRPPEVQLRLL